MKLKIYVAGPLGWASRARDVSVTLRERGYEITSLWPSLVDSVDDPSDDEVRRKILNDNLVDLHACDVVVALTDEGRPRATFAEIGYAIALGKKIVWWHDEDGTGRNIFDASAQVVRVTSLRGMLAELEMMAKEAA